MKDYVNIWEFGGRISVKVDEKFLKGLLSQLYMKYKFKRSAYNEIKGNINISFSTFNNITKTNYYRRQFIPLNIWFNLCRLLKVDICDLQKGIYAYKTSNGPNFISDPVLPVKITPIFDMIVAHNIADGTVINPKKRRLPYFGYRQFDPLFRVLYVEKLEAIFGKINFPNDYYLNGTRPYCPPVLASLFFEYYNLNVKSFLSREARIPDEIFRKSKDYLLAVLIAFIIDEGNIDSTLIVIRLKNIELTNDLFRICNMLGYKSTFSFLGEYGSLYILREGMIKFFIDYKKMKEAFPEINLGKWELKIENGMKIYKRKIYKTKGNRDIILNLLRKEDLTVNQISLRLNMTRQGVRFHIHNLERMDLILRIGYIGRKNIVYSYVGDTECS